MRIILRQKERTLAMKLGKEISQIRKEHSMTQEAFGQLFHVTRQTVSNWENEKSYPDLQTLVDMSDRFGISLDTLLKEDEHMIQTIDKERRAGKRLLKGILAAICAVAVICASYCGYWYYQKSSFEEQFTTTAQKYGFTPQILTDENGDDIATGRYIAQDGNTTYSVIPPDFPTLLSFDTSIDDGAKFITAECTADDQRLVLRCSPTDVMDESGDIQTEATFTTLYLDKGMQENSDGTFTPLLSPEYSLDDDGNPYAGHLDDETRAAYDAMKDDVQTAVTTMHTMLQDFYA